MIRIVKIIAEDISAPRLDGTQGSALYRVPLQLSEKPSPAWTRSFNKHWSRPPRFTTMHRPGIARIVGDRVVLSQTTIEEVESYHLETLKLVVECANRDEAVATQQKQNQLRRHNQRVDAHRSHVQDIADRLNSELD